VVGSTSRYISDLPLCLGVFKHRSPLARAGGGASSCLEFVANAVYMSDLIERNILTIPKFPEHVYLTACVGLHVHPSGPK
jgi:hypothetical protein